MPVTATGIAQGMRLTGRAKCRMRDELLSSMAMASPRISSKTVETIVKEEGEEHGVARDRALEELLVVVEADAAHRAQRGIRLVQADPGCVDDGPNP